MEQLTLTSSNFGIQLELSRDTKSMSNTQMATPSAHPFNTNKGLSISCITLLSEA